jgi:hypothetical protein
VCGLVSSVRKRRLKLVLEGETIKSRYLSRFAKLIICTQSRRYCFRSVRQVKDIISIAEVGRVAAFKHFKYGLKQCDVYLLEYLCMPVPLLCILYLAATSQNI